jgi:hypothetical protein
MLNRKEYLLNLVQEECAEVAKRASKCIRFGVYEVRTDRTKNNLQLLAEEYLDLMTIIDMLNDELCGEFGEVFNSETAADYMEAKRDKVEKYMGYSRECGLLETERIQSFEDINRLLQETEEEMPY